MTTTTDEDLRDLLTQTDMTPAQIEDCMANPYARVYAKLFLDRLHRAFAERIVERLVAEMFPEGVSDDRNG